MIGAVGAVADRLTRQVDASLNLDEMKGLMTRVHLLRAMLATHQSIRRLTGPGQDQSDLAVDALALTHLQLERCFIALLLVDNPKRWHVRYRKNAWKVFATKFFRDQKTVGHLDGYAEHFSPSGTGVTMLREFAREMNVWEDEFQTLRIAVSGDQPDPRWSRREIPPMPSPSMVPQALADQTRRRLAEVLYPYCSNLLSFVRGGLMGAMTGAILRGETPPGETQAPDHPTAADTWMRNVIETSLPNSYVAALLTATLFACPLDAGDPLRSVLHDAWCPYHSDGSPLGVALWDTWVGDALAESAGGTSDGPSDGEDDAT